MRIAHNPQTGEYLGLQGGEWKPLRTASNVKGEKLYLDVDGWKPLRAGNAETPDSPKEDGSTFGRGFSFGTRNVLEGLGSLPHMLLNEPINAIFGTNLKNPGEAIADLAGLEKAKTDSDRLLGAAVRGGVEALPAIVAGGAPVVAKALPRVASFLTAAPVEQLASGAAAGAASEAARQGGAGAWGQFGAGLVGGLAPSLAKVGGVAAKRAVNTTANMGDLLTESGRQKAAARQLRRAIGTENVDDVLTQLEKQEMPVEGVTPTLAQRTLLPRVAVMEKGLESAGVEGSDLLAHYTAQRDARQAIADELLDSMEARQADMAEAGKQRVSDAYRQVEDTADTLWDDRANMGTPEEMGAKVKGVFGELYGKEKQAVREAYQNIDPDGSTSFNLEPLRASFLEEIDPSPYAEELPVEIKKLLANMDNDVQNGVTRTYKDLGKMRTTLGDLITKAQASFDPNLARIAGGMKKRLDDYLMTAAEYADQPVVPKPGSAAYRDATKEALALSKAKVTADNPLWDTVWKHLDAESLYRDFPDAKRELADLHGRGLFARKGEGLPIDELADSLKRQGYLAPDADSSTLVELLKSKVRGKARSADELGNVLEGMTQYGTGFTQDQARAFNRATAMRREQGQRFEQGANKAMARTGETAMREASVMGNYFKQGAAGVSAAQDFLRSVGNDPRAMAAMRDYILGLFLKESTQDGKLSLPKMEAFFKRYDGALRQFPEVEQDLVNLIAQQAGADALASSVKDAGKQAASFGKTVLKRDTKQNGKLVGRDINEDVGKQLVEKGLLSAVEVERLKALTRSANRASRAMELAKVHGSPTSQNLATQEWMSNILGDNVDRQGGILNALLTAPFNPALKFLEKNLYGDTSQVIQRHLAKAMVDPEYAKKLLTLGKDASNTTKALQWLLGTGVDRNLKGAGDILKDTFKAQANVQLRGLLDLMGEDEPKKKKK